MKFSAASLATMAVAASAGDITDIKNVVIYMQENRAYDHYFGTMSGVRGFNDRSTVPMPTGLDAFHQPTNTSDLTQYMLPFKAENNKTNAQCMPAPEMFYTMDINMWNKGRMDRWNTERDAGVGMSYFDREGLPYYYELYDAFAAGDQYFQSTFTSTCPNREHLFSGTNGIAAPEETRRAALEDNTEDPPFDWVTVAELLEEKDISWKVYQEEDNFDDNGFAWHTNFKSAKKGDSLFDKGMARYKSAIDEFSKDVEADTLPQVSWVIAPAIKSEHATNHPAAGEDYSARLFAGLAANPDVYAKTALILNYDEGGQFFDHAFTPTPPLTDAEGVSTVDTENEINRETLLPDGVDAAPNGLGYRVPLLIISPWTRGNIVYSEVTDHVSVIKFLEKRFDIACPNLSPWRRAMVGDLTAAFDFESTPDYSWPTLPDTSDYARKADAECLTLPDIVVPTEQSMPKQEPGTRISRALPYTFLVTGGVTDDKLSFKIDNTGTQGAPFVLFDVANNADVNPKQYAVEGGKSITHEVTLESNSDSSYSYFLYGPNGFVRSWTGSTKTTPPLSVHMEYDEANDSVTIVATGEGKADIVDNAYGLDTVSVAGGESATIDTSASGNWYDFSVAGQRFMGRMETGKDGISDPAMAAGVPGLWQKNEQHPPLEEHLRVVKRSEHNGAKKQATQAHKDALFDVSPEGILEALA